MTSLHFSGQQTCAAGSLFSFSSPPVAVVVVHMMLRSRTMVPFRVKAARPERLPPVCYTLRIRNNIPLFFSAAFFPFFFKVCVSSVYIIYPCLLYILMRISFYAVHFLKFYVSPSQQ